MDLNAADVPNQNLTETVQPLSMPVVDVEPTSSPPESQLPAVKPTPFNPKLRKWTSAAGEYSVEAEFRSMVNGVVKMRRADDGKVISVPVEKLSAGDPNWLEDYRRSK